MKASPSSSRPSRISPLSATSPSTSVLEPHSSSSQTPPTSATSPHPLSSAFDDRKTSYTLPPSSTSDPFRGTSPIEEQTKVHSHAPLMRMDGFELALERVRQGWITARRALLITAIAPSPPVPSFKESSTSMKSARMSSARAAIERVQVQLLAIRTNLDQASGGSQLQSFSAQDHPPPHLSSVWTASTASSSSLPAPEKTSMIRRPYFGFKSPSAAALSPVAPTAFRAPSLPPASLYIPVPGTHIAATLPSSSYTHPLSTVPVSSATFTASLHHLLSRFLAFCDRVGTASRLSPCHDPLTAVLLC
ncbi:hypothetical protein A4X13_0g9285 [Tilletia indica]|uniref:Uncharacterized protein n=1 Tax=Tilletia indica TaxID=43049 RepID=A0A8T8SAC2_9BASI|nr:hypothetical protein A4X13_0g9285 [Tilletia indica]